MPETVSLPTIPEVARRLGVSPQRVRAAIQREGITPAARAGRYLLFDREGVRRIRAAVHAGREAPR